MADLPHDADRALPCRPTIACTAEIAAPGTLEVEAGASVADASGGRSWSYPFLFKQTLSKLVQVQLGSNGFAVVHGAAAPIRYVDNVALGPKLHLVDQGNVAPAIAVSAAGSVPTFHATGYARHVDASLVAYVTKDVGPVHLDLNVGANLWGLEQSAAAQALGALALSGALYGPIGGLVEGYAFSAADPIAPRDGGLRGGITLTPRPFCVFDFGGDVGWFPKTRAATVFVGVTIIPVVFGSTNEGGQ
jgi:hypothetical protein